MLTKKERPCEIQTLFPSMPLVAILRGVRPEEVVDIGEALYRAGLRFIEVPLNSPEPYQSIARLNEALGDRCVCGAGTVVNADQVDAVAETGATLVVAPNTDAAVIGRALELGLTVMPGVATATEVFQAYRLGARYLKLFPASSYGVGHVKALKSVMPEDARLLAVGGVGAVNAREWFAAGTDGLGVGKELFTPGFDAEKVYRNAIELVAAVS